MQLLSRFYTDGVPGAHHLLLQGVAVTLLGTTFASWLFPAEASLMSVFLAAIATSDSVERILDDNRRRILERGETPLAANSRLIGLVLALFLGAVLGFSGLGLVLALEDVQFLFSHQLEDYGGQSFADLRFGNFSTLAIHNIYVLLFFFVIAIPFRQGGVMLAVAWNASVWGSTFGFLARRWTERGGPGLGEAYLRVMATVTPHMAFEACAYVLAGFSGVFLSKALLKYDLDSPILFSIGKTVLVMVGLGALFLGAGALWESAVTPMLLAWLS